MVKITHFSTAIFLIGMFLIGGCAKRAGMKLEIIPDGMALIYIYRPPNMRGAFNSYDVTVGNEKAFTLRNSRCHHYFAKPGELEVWAETEIKSSVTLDVKSGGVYFVRGTVEFGWEQARPHLELVPKDTVKPWQVEDCPEINQ